VTVLSAAALDADPLGCDLLKAIIKPTVGTPHRDPAELVPPSSSISLGRAAAGFLASLTLLIVGLVALSA
jgi:hypothetical protein